MDQCPAAGHGFWQRQDPVLYLQRRGDPHQQEWLAHRKWYTACIGLPRLKHWKALCAHNAERFGLARLHQLRGRVGRSKDASACVLVTEDRNNERLAAICQYNDGFKISEMDLMQRGAGDLIGSQQSGTEKYLSLALAYPGEYDTAKAIGKRLLDSHEGCSLLEKAIFDFREFEAKTAGK